MHFGASSMVWPMNWGKESGSSFIEAFIGVFITALLLVVIAYIALAKGKNFYLMTHNIVSKKFANFFTVITILILGPLYVIPRMSAVSWDSFVAAFGEFGINIDNQVYLIAFTIIFYFITYVFMRQSEKIMDKISKILLPVLLIIVMAIIIKGLINPIAEPVTKIYEKTPFAYGFTNGYATAEVLCALIFGSVIFANLKSKGVHNAKLIKNMIRVGIVGIALLTVTHFFHMWIGANTGGTIDKEYTALYTDVVSVLFGKWGGMIFSIALFFAALTTAIGMTSGCTNFFVENFNLRLRYKQFLIIFLFISTIFGCLGLTNLLSYLSPILDALYPPAIILVLFYAFVKNSNNPRFLLAAKFSFIMSFSLGIIDAIWKYFVKLDFDFFGITHVYEQIPLANSSLLWIPFAIIAFLIGLLAYRNKHSNSHNEVCEKS